ncbi:MAG TPA: sigma-54 dependent transcriptional regulator [Verrucomicrobiae bacterium]|nr:sigma-54 dependent transcriptional regulator [Verrucomicrobiae bacterium]
MPLSANPAAGGVLLVDDEPEVVEDAAAVLRSRGISSVVSVTDSRQVMDILARERIALAVIDIMMPHISGTELLASILRDHPQLPVMVMTAVDDVETAVECMKQGAFDYLLKPVDASRLVAAAQKALQLNDLHNENATLRDYLLHDRLRHPDAFADIVTCSKGMRAIFQYIEAIAGSGHPVLITGETGVGKELIARAIHRLSGLPGEFVSVNVGGLDDPLFSDTLFGHRKGAYTGADQPREGLIRKATGGTLFLDEIGDLTETSQTKLLRLLQEGEYYPVGSDALKKSDARVIASTNRDIPELIARGAFRKDLYYRLCAHPIEVPPLRRRREDIPLLLSHFVEQAARSAGREIPVIAPELYEFAGTCTFAGNVRELQGVVRDAVARHAGGELRPEHFPMLAKRVAREELQKPLPDILLSVFGRFPTVTEVEDYMIEEAMRRTNGNKSATAALLGITRPTLNRRLQQKEGAAGREEPACRQEGHLSGT